MFSNLGLFRHYQCPQRTHHCDSAQCWFSHNDSRPNQTKSIGSDAPPLEKRPRVSQSTAPVMHNTQRSPTVDEREAIGTTALSRTSNATGTSWPTSTPRPPLNLDDPPRLQLGKLTPQPISDRQKALRTLFTQFQKLYSALLAQHPTLAHESALAQEKEISGSTNNLKAYKTAIHHAAVSVSRRPKPDSVPHTSIGTVKESRAAEEAQKLAKASRLTPERLQAYCVSQETLVEWGYPDPNVAALQSPATPRPSSEGTTTTCLRCKIDFVVLTTQTVGDCMFHHGKTAPERVDGRRMWIYSCCKKERGSAGCEEGVHVFSDRDDDIKLAERAPYKTTSQVIKDKPLSQERKFVDVVGIDCEMISTTAGSSLARVSIIDEDGVILLDEHVRQTVPVLDYNTRFSGVRAPDLENAVMDLNEVRAAACTFIGPGTVIVGHGLENDLRALRLLHPLVIDTAILFPHDKGRPYRRALRDLVKEKLGFFIQTNTADAGHSSVEDAKATLDLLKWKVRDDQSSVP